MKRGSGILLGISSLPGPCGIGSLGSPARHFVTRLKTSLQSYWQILPASPTGFGDSPYQAFSSFAGNPYFIDFADLYRDGLLTKSTLEKCVGMFHGEAHVVDYYLQYKARPNALYLVWRCGAEHLQDEIKVFQKKHAAWINDYALFMALKNEYQMKPYFQWPAELAQRRPEALKAAARHLEEQMAYHVFVQYLFFRQWDELHKYAKEKGILIIGDMPIYMAPDSADAWTNGALLDKNGRVAGCPPDYFSQTGQLWGNPVYDWNEHEKTNYDWWRRRIVHQLSLYDYLRIDHFRGFEAFYAIAADAKDAINGEWVPGPGLTFFSRLKEELGELPLIAEDLGYLTPEVFQLLVATGFPGLKVLQFAFSPDGKSIYLPHCYESNCLVYTGTHDNDTTIGWYRGLSLDELAFLDAYLDGVQEEHLHWQLIRLAMASVADVCIFPMQDVLGLPSSARMNRPQTAQGNWQWRLTTDQFDDVAAKKLADLTRLFGRAD